MFLQRCFIKRTSKWIQITALGASEGEGGQSLKYLFENGSPRKDQDRIDGVLVERPYPSKFRKSTYQISRINCKKGVYKRNLSIYIVYADAHFIIYNFNFKTYKGRISHI